MNANISDTENRNEIAIRIIENIEDYDLSSWLMKIEKQLLNSIPITVMEYTSILYIIKELSEQEVDSPDFIDRFKKIINKSYIDFSGHHPEKEDWRLPKKVLRCASKDEVLFHQAFYHSGVHGLLGSIGIIISDYIIRRNDIINILIIAVILLCIFFYTPYIYTVMLGLVIGYIFSSITEYFVHKYVAHAAPKNRNKFSRYGKIGYYMSLLNTEHSVHHGSVSKNYTEIFSPSDTSSLDAKIKRDKRIKDVEKSVLKLGGESFLKSVRKSRYGLTSANLLRSHSIFILSSFILTLFSYLTVQALGLEPGVLFAISVFIMSQVWITSSTSYHCYLHMAREHGLKEANPIMRFYLKTRFSNFIARSHRTHHSTGGRINQNLTPLFDFIVGWSPVSLSDMVDLRKRKTFY